MIGAYAKKMDNTWFGVACDDKVVYASTFAASEETVFDNLMECMPKNLEFEKKKTPSKFAERILELIKKIFDGKDVTEKSPLYTEHLRPFTKRAILATYSIPVGYVSSYGAIAKATDGGARAVGNVMARNPFCPLVPCHRVICSDFRVGGYGRQKEGNISVKLAFLKREKRGYLKQKEIQVEGAGRLRIYPTEFVLEKMQKQGTKV